MQERYKNGGIDTTSTYIYKKFKQLINKKVLLPTWFLPQKYVQAGGFINIFDLHSKLEDIISIYHIPKKRSKLYTLEEREYMERLSKRL